MHQISRERRKSSGRRRLIRLCVLALLVIPSAPPARAGFPGANGAILVQRLVGEGCQLFTVSPSTGEVRQISRGSDCKRGARWSPSGSRIVYSSGTHDTYSGDIYVMDSDGSSIRQVTSGRAADGAPAWAPSGKRFVFTRIFKTEEGGFNYELFVMRTDGTGLHRLTRRPLYDGDPVWSPNGRRILFVSERDGDAELFTIRPDGTGLSRLTRNRADDESPDWAPDGTRIVFSRMKGSQPRQVVVARPGNASAGRYLTAALDDAAFPTWSPNGRRIAFTMDDGSGARRLFSMRISSEDLQRVTTEGSGDYGPDWQPIPRQQTGSSSRSALMERS